MPPPPPVPDRTETLNPRADSEVGIARPVVRDDDLEADHEGDDPERYEQVCEHARGGLGRVVRAVDKRLGRTVAVKEMLRGKPSPDHEARFLREALITARLEHPGIVPVHEAGRWPNGDPYYVMKLVEGRTLKELITTSETLRDRLGLLPHVIAVADAVGYAHSQGVIHRDLKPSNVIVGEFGETIVVDWGLARDTRRDHSWQAGPEVPTSELTASGSGAETVSGKVIGTPAYMSPEQARGEQVDERADVYAIGAVLYELLTGLPPHHVAASEGSSTPQATLDRVLAGPPRPVGLVPHVPGELATIVSKAMERDPEARYANATALAEDLRRYQTGKLVSAHSYSTWALLRKKLSAHRGVVVMAVASAIALGAVGVESFRRVVAERNIAQQNSQVAKDAQRDSEKRQRDLVLLQAVTSLRKDPTASLAWLKPIANEKELADADRAHVRDVVDEAIALGVARHVFRPNDWVFDAAFTPDGSTVVAAVRDGSVRAYDLRTGLERRLGKAESAPELLEMSPDGSVVVTGGTTGEVTAWPVAGGEPRVLVRGNRMVHALAFSSDKTHVLVQRESGPAEAVALDGSKVEILGDKTGYRMVVATKDWTRRVVATSPNSVAAVDNGVSRPLAQTPRLIQRIIMSPSGDSVMLHDGTTIWRVPYSGGPLTKLVDYPAKLNHIMWSPDGRTVAICGDIHDVVLVDLATDTARYLRGHTDAIYTLEWTRDGRRILSAGDDGTARVWTVSDGTADVLRGHDDDVYRARFSADERSVVSSSLDGSVRVWVIEQPGARELVEGSEIEDIQIDGSSLRTQTGTQTARWNTTSGHREPLFSWAADPNGLGIGIPSPDGEKLLMLNADWSIEVRSRGASATATLTLRGHKTVITHVEFSRDSQFVYTSSIDGTLRRWDLATGEATILLQGEEPVRGFAIAADGRVAAQVGDSVKLIQNGHTTILGQGERWCILKAEFDKVRDRLIMRRCDHSLVLRDGDKMIELPTGNYPVSRIAASPDGSKIAGAMGDRTVRLWDAETGRVLRVLRGHSDLVLDVAFSPDGTLIASASYDKTIRVWDLESDRHRVLRGHALAVNRIVWRDNHELVSGSRDGTLRIWEAPALDLPTSRDLAAQLEAATSARIDIDRPTTGAQRGI